jgi:hypothetical protein
MTGRPPLRRRRILYKAGDAQSSENCLEKSRIWSRVDWKKLPSNRKAVAEKHLYTGHQLL